MKTHAEQIADGCRNLTVAIPRVASRPYRQHYYMSLRKPKLVGIADQAGIREMVLQALRNRGNTLSSNQNPTKEI